MVIDKLLNHTLCVSYFTELILGIFGSLPVNSELSRHFWLAILLFAIYCIKLIWGTVIIGPVNKSYTLC